MTHFWQDLIQQQAVLDSQYEVDSTSYYTPLPNLGVLHVSGAEAQSFLQNLLTNDVAALSINQAQLSGFCNAKGRLFALFLLVRRQDFYQLILPKEMCSSLLQRLTMYKLRSDVVISDESEQLVCLGSISTETALAASDLTIQLPNDIRRSLSICSSDDAESLVSQLSEQQWQLAPQTLWQRLDIEFGTPQIVELSKEKFTPQQINLDLIDGVSFSKGCYPGQEVVARLHYLGKPSRRLFIAEASTNAMPSIADEITTDDDSVAGHIVSAQFARASQLKLLITLKLSSKNNNLFIGKTTGITVLDSDIVDE